MNAKQLLLLAGAAAVLAGIATWTSRNESRQGSTPALGSRVLPALKDQVNEVATLSVQGLASTVTVSKAEGIWRLPGKWNYPADFSKVRDALNALADLKVLQTLRGSPAERSPLQLLTADEAAATNAALRATRVELLGPDGKPLAVLHLGKTRSRLGAGDAMGREGFPDSRYVMSDKGQAALAADALMDLASPLESWMDPEFVSLSDIVSVNISRPSQPDLALDRPNPGVEFKLSGDVPAGKTLNQAKVQQTGSALSGLRFDDIADPRSASDVTGLAAPVTYQARSQNGQIVKVQIGKATPDGTRRYAAVSVAFEAPALPPAAGTNQEAAVKARAAETARLAMSAKALNDKLSPWIYLLNREATDPMTLAREDFLSDQAQTGKAPDEEQAGTPARE